MEDKRDYVNLPHDNCFVSQAARRVARYFARTRDTIPRKRQKKARNRVAERQAFSARYDAVPTDTVRVFTDGSSYGNPGPGGAGYYIYGPHMSPEPHLLLYPLSNHN